MGGTRGLEPLISLDKCLNWFNKKQPLMQVKEMTTRGR